MELILKSNKVTYEATKEPNEDNKGYEQKSRTSDHLDKYERQRYVLYVT